MSEVVRARVEDYLFVLGHMDAFCRERGNPFVDLTAVFRAQDTATALFLAPLDFHANPAGNAVVAQGIADGLIQHGLIEVDWC